MRWPALRCFSVGQRIPVGPRDHAHLAAAMQLRPAFDDQLIDLGIAAQATTVDDFQAVADGGALQLARHQQSMRPNRADDRAALADRDFSSRGYLTVEFAIDVEFAGNGQITDKAGSMSDDGGS